MNWNKHLLNNRQFLSIVALAGCAPLQCAVMLPGQRASWSQPPPHTHVKRTHRLPSAWPLHTDHLGLLDRYVKGEMAFLP